MATGKSTILATQAHTNLNMFAAVASLLESGCIYPVGRAPTSAGMIADICRAEQQRQLKIYDANV